MTPGRRLALAAGVVAALAAAWLVAPPPARPTRQAREAVPRDLADGWTVAAPSRSGMDVDRLRQVVADAMSGPENLHGILVARHGELVAELYGAGSDASVYVPIGRQRDFGPDTLHDTRSMSKSVVSLLIGVARQEGRIPDLASPVLRSLPELADLATPGRSGITLAHLLTMSSGLAWREGDGFPDDEHGLYWRSAQARYVLGRPLVSPPGARFNYNSGGTAVLAAILARATGLPLSEYARRTLFAPLGIERWEWAADLHGRPLAFVGLRLRPRDLAKIGRLVLDQGAWQGRQIIPADWIAASLEPRVDTGIAGFSYGYQWWLGNLDWAGGTTRSPATRWAAAFGNGGQRLFVVPALDLCVVITAGAYGDARIGPRVYRLFTDVVATVRE